MLPPLLPATSSGDSFSDDSVNERALSGTRYTTDSQGATKNFAVVERMEPYNGSSKI